MSSEEFYVSTKQGGGKEFAIAEEGIHNAILVKVQPNAREREYPNEDGTKKKVWSARFYWEIEDKDDDGNPITVIQEAPQKWGTAVKPSRMRTLVEKLIGTKLTQDQCESFNIMSLVGTQNRITVEHTERDGKVYANVGGIMKKDPAVDLVPSKRFSEVPI